MKTVKKSFIKLNLARLITFEKKTHKGIRWKHSTSNEIN